jgi:hypothetical protein
MLCFIPPLLGLFRDDYDDIRETAAALLRRDARASPVRYLELLNDTNPKVRVSAVLALYHTQPGSISQPEVLQLLRDPDPVVRKRAWFFFEVVAGTDFAGDPDRVAKWCADRQTGPGSD